MDGERMKIQYLDKVVREEEVNDTVYLYDTIEELYLAIHSDGTVISITVNDLGNASIHTQNKRYIFSIYDDEATVISREVFESILDSAIDMINKAFGR